MKFFWKILDFLVNTFMAIGVLGVVIMCMSEIISRNFFSTSIGWSSEAARYFFVYVVFIGAGVLTCPKLMANSLTMEIGAGTIQMEEYSARRASITVGAGEIIVDRGRVNDMDIEVGMGSFFFQGNIDGDLDVECGMGNTELELEASEEDYNYQIDCGMGNVTVGSVSYSGVGAGHKIDNNSEFDFDLECGMGNLEIRFVE